MRKFDVIIPAGGHLDAHFSDVVGTNSKPLIRFEGVTILYRILHAFRASGVAERIVVVGTQEVIDSSDVKLADLAVLEKGSSPANIQAGLVELSRDAAEPDRVLICTGDVPFITPEAITNFVAQCGDKDFYAPLISEEDYAEVYPGSPATFVKLKEGSITTGSIFNVNSIAVKKCLTYIEQVFQHRKSKLGMANILGVGFTLKYLTRQLRISDVEQRISELLHCSASGIQNGAPELAYDVDYLEDYHYALQNYHHALRGKWMPPPPQ
jgi:CTP:molybdopterin cytidylyltransferase MocA